MNSLIDIPEKISSRHLFQAIAIGIFLLVVSATAFIILPNQSDWSNAYRPATLQLLAGQNPYTINASASIPFLNAPWILIPLIPLAILPPLISRAVVFAVSILVYAFIAIKLGAKPIGLAAFLLSFPVIYGLIYGQIDWLVSLGFILPPTLGIFLILAKPQVGIGFAIFLLFQCWRTGNWKKLLSTFGPVSIAFVLSIWLYGNWVALAWFPLDKSWNTSLWPQSIPIGLVLLVSAIREKKSGPAIVSSPFMSPYLAAHSWSVALLGIISNTTLTMVASVGIWIVWLLGGGPIDR